MPGLISLIWTLGGTLTAHAEPTSHALVIGSNRPGPGQQVLRHAIDDAERMASVLTGPGGVPAANVHLLADPDPADIEATITALSAAIAADRAVGDPSTLMFYYSGHARSSGLSLGEGELGLTRLREQLESAGASLTLVVLDACQSGAFSTAKGIEPAADFSHNSVSDLNTTGFVVIASSSAAELSQESPELGGSFFTHHLVTGMRGAADEDIDGLITLSEAYRYAYSRTLIDTATTAIGTQHVTLETALSGQGEMVLSRPVEASARLLLPSSQAAEILIHHEPSRVVAAEIHKAAGAPMSLALIPGDYTLTLRQDGQLLRCPLRLEDHDSAAFTARDCQPLQAISSVDKGEGAALTIPAARRVMIEGSLGLLATGESDYTSRLTDFGYRQSIQFVTDAAMLTGAVVIAPDERRSVVVAVGTLDGQTWKRSFTDDEDTEQTDAFSWQVLRAGLYPRLSAPLGSGRWIPYAQGGAGGAIALTTYAGQDGSTAESPLRWHLAGAAGIQAMGKKGRVGLYSQAELVYAPLPINLLSDRHNSGGFNLQIGLRAGG